MVSWWGLRSLNRILDIDYDNRTVTCQPGVTNLSISKAVDARGFYYAPDPSSQIACTIGGNIAENSGGVHCLKYGLTTNNVLGVEIVTIDGQVIRIGGKHFDAEGYDLLGILTGSEGLLGIVTEVTVRILPKPETARALLIGFASNEEAGATVAAIIGAGIIPAGMEMMDRPAIHAAEAFVRVGYPLDVEALLIVELDGPAPEVDHLCAQVTALAQAQGAVSCRMSTSEPERLAFWAGRKAAFPAVGRISPDYFCMDGTIPRKALPHVLARLKDFETEFGLRVANVFHAGDGNLHPLILFDSNQPGEPRARGSIRRRHPEAVRAGGRRAHRRARRGRGEARPDDGAVHRERPRASGTAQVRVRSGGPAQPGEGVSGAASMCGAWPPARASR